MGIPELILVPLFLAAGAFWIWMLIDCVTNEASVGNDKLVWIVIIVFAGIIGAIIYYFVRHCARAEMERAKDSSSFPPTPPASSANPL